jgi:hypothetical protein
MSKRIALKASKAPSKVKRTSAHDELIALLDRFNDEQKAAALMLIRGMDALKQATLRRRAA